MDFRRIAALAASGLLAAALAPPVAADDPPVPASVSVDVSIVGYTLNTGEVSLRLSCDSGLAEPYWFGLRPGEIHGTFGPYSVPVANCEVRVDGLGDPGDLGEWGGWWTTPGGSQLTAAGQTTHFEVTVQHEYNGRGPDWDVYGWIELPTFTVDRVVINKSGGITAEGAIWCPGIKAFAAATTADLVYVGVDWDATQYLGRKTAIHGSYRADIANRCFNQSQPTTPLRWDTRRGSASGAIWYVYGTDGRFASGTVVVAASVGAEFTWIVQRWDPSRPDYDARCSTAVRADGFYDQNKDGFCAYYEFIGGRTVGTVKTTTLRTR